MSSWDTMLRVFAFAVAFGIFLPLGAGCSRDVASRQPRHDGAALSDAPLEAEGFGPGVYRLQFTLTGATGPQDRPQAQHVDMTFVVNKSQHVLRVVSVTSNSKGAPVQATIFPDAAGRLQMVDYQSCRIDTTGALPTDLSVETFLTDTIGPLPQGIGNGRFRTSIRQDDGQIAVTVHDDASGRLASRTVVQADRTSGQMLARIAAISLRQMDSTATSPEIPPATMCPHLRS